MCKFRFTSISSANIIKKTDTYTEAFKKNYDLFCIVFDLL